ncbi:MAG: hypothetical protein QOH21_2107 [Acidobacteriota bacterium]|jgi:hypothetical protein|nr:hypothetical protein [Acidobacteriota bacterium]
MKVTYKVAIILVVLAIAVPIFADDEQKDAVTCRWKDANGDVVGRVQESCSGSVAVHLYTGKSWSEATSVSCSLMACSLGSICASGTDSYIVDGQCTCATASVIDEITQTEVDYNLPWVSVWSPGCI